MWSIGSSHTSFSSRGMQAQLPCSMWVLPDKGSNPCLSHGQQTPNHWTTREALSLFFFFFWCGPFFKSLLNFFTILLLLYALVFWPQGMWDLSSPGESDTLSRVRLFVTPWTVAYQGSSVDGIFQARILEWYAISFSRRSSWPRDWTQTSHIVGRCFTVWATRANQESNLHPAYWKAKS